MQIKAGDEIKKGKNPPLTLDDLKRNYLPIQEKYTLPSFHELNEVFSIEKIDGTETDFLLREVRRIISETFSNYLTILENLLNPANAPVFIFSVVKCMSSEEKKKLSEIYMALAREWATLLQLDLVYSEEREAEFIKKTYTLWKNYAADFYKITENVKRNWDHTSDTKKSDYLG